MGIVIKFHTVLSLLLYK